MFSDNIGRYIKVVCIVAVMLLCMSINAFAEKNDIIVNDTFEEYAVGDVPKGWEIDPNNKSSGAYGCIEADPNNPDNKVLTIGGARTALTTAKRVFSKKVGGIVTIECRVRLGDSEKDVHWIAVTEPTVLNNMQYMGSFTMYSGNGMRVMNNVTIDYTRWYDLKYEINTLTQTFSYWFGGMLIYEDEPFNIKDIESFERLRFSVQYNKTYIDDLKVTMTGGVAKLYIILDSISDVYVDKSQKLVTNVFKETTVNSLLKRLKFVEGAKINLINKDGTPYDNTYVSDDMVINIQSPDMTQSVDYSIVTRTRYYGTMTAKYLKEASAFYLSSPYVVNKNVRTLISGENNAGAFLKNDELYIPLRELCDGMVSDIIYKSDSDISIGGKKLDEGYIINNDKCFIKVSEAEKLGFHVDYKDDKLIVFRNSEFDVRESVKRTVIKEVKKRFTQD